MTEELTLRLVPGWIVELLEDPDQHEHIAIIDGYGFFKLRHPLVERREGALEACVVHDDIVDLIGDLAPGRYRVVDIGSTGYRFDPQP